MPDAVSGRRLHLRLLTQAGNATALVWLALVLAQGALLFGPTARLRPAERMELAVPEPGGAVGPAEPLTAGMRAAPASPASRVRAQRVLLIVVDALRADVAADPQWMPRLARLARQGGWGTARVDSALPSTIAGLRTLVEGTVPPPASFLEDFRARPAERGGLFAAVAAAGGRSFAAGPRLWTDLYGRWIDRAVRVPTVHGDDRRVEQAATAALRDPGLRLLVVHFGEADDAAHSFGAGKAYLEAVARADAALGRLAAAAGPETALLVTSDHGVTNRGGHAGPEPEVLTVPVVTAGPGMPRGRLGELRQQDLRFLVREALGLQAHELPAQGLPDGETAVPRVPPQWEGAGWDRGEARRGAFRTGQQVPLIRAGALLAAGLVLAAAVVHLGAAWAGRVRGWGPLVLDASFWTALLLLLLGWRGAALALVVGALAVGALAVRPASAGTSATWTGTGRRASSPASPYLIFAALTAGVLAGAGRLAEGALTSRGALPPGSPGALALLVACALAAVAGRWLGRRLPGDPWKVLAAGVAAALVPMLCARLTGETVSLSSLDVRLAFRLADGPLGLSGAALAATLRAVLPALSLAAGLAWTLRRIDPLMAGRFYAGLGAGLCGQALAATLLLTFRPLDTVAVALATGQLVRLFGEMSFLFLGCAAGAGLGRRRAS